MSRWFSCALVGGLAVALLLVNPVRSQDANSPDVESAASMVAGCRDYIGDRTGNGFVRGLCVGLIIGALKNGGGICFRDVKLKEIVQAVVDYIDSQPARIDENFNNLALEAMRKTWPCR